MRDVPREVVFPELSRPIRAANRCPETCGCAQARALTRRRAAREIIRRVIPLKSMLIPTSVPSTHSVLDGQVRQIRTARIKVTMPSTKSHPDPGRAADELRG